jgi:hypothetical protein
MSVLHRSSIRPFFIFKPRHHAFPNAFSFKSKIALLSNDDTLPTADAFTECFEENLLPNGVFSTKLGPQVSLFPVPIFGVNSRSAPAQASGAAGLSSGPAGLGNEGDGLGSGMIGHFETDPAIGDAFLASQASATSGAQRRRRAASSKRVRDDEV